MTETIRVACLAFAVAGAVLAQTYEIGVFGGLSRLGDQTLGSLNDTDPKDDDTRMEGDNHSVGFRLTWNTKGYYGHEITYEKTKATIRARIAGETAETDVIREDSVGVHQVGYNLMMYFMPAGSRWRPYMTVGAQVHQYGAPSFDEWYADRSRNLGVNYGGGIKLLISRHVILRFDGRDNIGLKPYGLQFEDEMKTGGATRNWGATAGISVAF